MCTLLRNWSMDFVHDQLANGKKIRFLIVVDTFSRFSRSCPTTWCSNGVTEQCWLLVQTAIRALSRTSVWVLKWGEALTAAIEIPMGKTLSSTHIQAALAGC